MKIRVYYEDTDAGGIVFHANYIKYCERARSELFFRQGIAPMEGEQSGFVVRNITAEFVATAKLGELLEVKSHLKEKRASSLILRQEVYRESTYLFGMDVVLVYTEAGRPRRIPKRFQTIFTLLEENP